MTRRGPQCLEIEGRLPVYVLACVGGGSNAAGIFYPFVDDASVKLIGIEAGGRSSALGEHAATLTHGKPGVLHGALSYVLQDDDGQTADVHSCSAGLDYPGVGPEHAYWKDQGGRLNTRASLRRRGSCGLFNCSPAWRESSPRLKAPHAIAQAAKLYAPRCRASDRGVINLSGQGDKDCQEVARAGSQMIARIVSHDHRHQTTTAAAARTRALRLSTAGRFFAGYAWLILKNLIGWAAIWSRQRWVSRCRGRPGVPLFLIGFCAVCLSGKRTGSPACCAVRGSILNRAIRSDRIAVAAVFCAVLFWPFEKRYWNQLNLHSLTTAFHITMALVVLSMMWVLTRAALARPGHVDSPDAPRVRRKYGVAASQRNSFAAAAVSTHLSRGGEMVDSSVSADVNDEILEIHGAWPRRQDRVAKGQALASPRTEYRPYRMGFRDHGSPAAKVLAGCEAADSPDRLRRFTGVGDVRGGVPAAVPGDLLATCVERIWLQAAGLGIGANLVNLGNGPLSPRHIWPRVLGLS